MKRGMLLFIFIALTIPAVFAAGSGEGCYDDSECDGALLCDDSVCIPPGQGTAAGATADEACAEHDECAEGYACSSETYTCVPTSTLAEITCVTVADCDVGFTCHDSYCILDIASDDAEAGITPDNPFLGWVDRGLDGIVANTVGRNSEAVQEGLAREGSAESKSLDRRKSRGRVSETRYAGAKATAVDRSLKGVERASTIVSQKTQRDPTNRGLQNAASRLGSLAQRSGNDITSLEEGTRTKQAVSGRFAGAKQRFQDAEETFQGAGLGSFPASQGAGRRKAAPSGGGFAGGAAGARQLACAPIIEETVIDLSVGSARADTVRGGQQGELASGGRRQGVGGTMAGARPQTGTQPTGASATRTGTGTSTSAQSRLTGTRTGTRGSLQSVTGAIMHQGAGESSADGSARSAAVRGGQQGELASGGQRQGIGGSQVGQQGSIIVTPNLDGSFTFTFDDGSSYDIFSDNGASILFTGEKINVYTDTGTVTGSEVAFDPAVNELYALSVDGNPIQKRDLSIYGAPLLMLGTQVVYSNDATPSFFVGRKVLVSLEDGLINGCELSRTPTAEVAAGIGAGGLAGAGAERAAGVRGGLQGERASAGRRQGAGGAGALGAAAGTSTRTGERTGTISGTRQRTGTRAGTTAGTTRTGARTGTRTDTTAPTGARTGARQRTGTQPTGVSATRTEPTSAQSRLTGTRTGRTGTLRRPGTGSVIQDVPTNSSLAFFDFFFRAH